MPATRDGKTWRSQFYYEDWQGVRHKKNKRGFKTKAEAEEWERNFRQQQRKDLDINFENFVEIYFADVENRLRESTIRNKRYVFDLKVTPYFKKKKMKSGTISIILGALGILLIIWFNYQTYELYQTEFLKIQSSSLIEPTIVTTGKSYKLIALGIAILGILFGIKSMREKSKSGKIGIILSIIALILTFIPVWTLII